MTRRPSRPIRGAYDYARTDIACPNCGAEPYSWCRTPSGSTRLVPCVSRIQAPLDAEVVEDDAPRPDLRLVPNTYEPRRGRDDDEMSVQASHSLSPGQTPSPLGDCTRDGQDDAENAEIAYSAELVTSDQRQGSGHER